MSFAFLLSDKKKKKITCFYNFLKCFHPSVLLPTARPPLPTAQPWFHDEHPNPPFRLLGFSLCVLSLLFPLPSFPFSFFPLTCVFKQLPARVPLSGKNFILTSSLLASSSGFKIQSPQPHTLPPSTLHRQNYLIMISQITSELTLLVELWGHFQKHISPNFHHKWKSAISNKPSNSASVLITHGHGWLEDHR